MFLCEGARSRLSFTSVFLKCLAYCCSWIFLHLSIPMCNFQMTQKWNHIFQKKSYWRQIQIQFFKEISNTILKCQVQDRLTNTPITHEHTHWQASHQFISSLGGKVLSGHSAIIPSPTVALRAEIMASCQGSVEKCLLGENAESLPENKVSRAFQLLTH